MKFALWGWTVGLGLIAFLTSIVWYSPLLFGGIWRQGNGGSLGGAATWKFAVAPLREIFTAFTVLYILQRMPPLGMSQALLFAAILWAGFYGVQLTGAVLWDGKPLGLGLIHSGDWLIKLTIITVGASMLLNRFGPAE